MADEPFFPAARPRAQETTTTTEVAATTPTTSATSATSKAVVRRPDAPIAGTDEATAAPKPTRLTREEVHALLAVEQVNRPSKLVRTAKRSVILVPTGIVGFVLHVAFGDWGFVASILITIAALAWMARPLLATSRDGWT